jgi:hypothetical protein
MPTTYTNSQYPQAIPIKMNLTYWQATLALLHSFLEAFTEEVTNL